MKRDGVVDLNHPVFTPRPVRREDEEGWEYKWRVDAWARARKKRRPMSRAVRKAVFDRDGNKCVNCGSNERLAVDHIHPWSKGGADVMDNYQTLCVACNARKGDSVVGGDVESG